MNKPINVTAASRKHTKYHGPFLAILFVIKETVHLRTKFVFANGYTRAKVKIKNATVVLPKAPANVELNPKTGISPSARSVIILGQSMDNPIHMINDPKNTPRTAIASADSPAAPGINLDPMITTRARINTSVDLVSFFFIVILLSHTLIK